MKHLLILLVLTAGVASCTRTETYPLGTDVTVVRNDGSSVSGRLIEVKQDRLVVQRRDGGNSEILKSQVTSLKTMTAVAEPNPTAEAKPPETPASAPPATQAVPRAIAEPTPPPAAAPPPASRKKPRAVAAAKETPTTPPKPSIDQPSASAAHPSLPVASAGVAEATPPPPPPLPEFRELTIPSGTTLSATLATSLASNTSKVEDVVRATLKTPVSIEGFDLLPAGAKITGHVTRAEAAAKVKGRALLAFRFNSVDRSDGTEHITTETITREAASTKGKDAAKIGIGAAAGGVIGGIIGGGSGAATGAAVGGGAGTAAVLATSGDEVTLPAGTPVTITLTAPLTIRVQIK